MTYQIYNYLQNSFLGDTQVLLSDSHTLGERERNALEQKGEAETQSRPSPPWQSNSQLGGDSKLLPEE